MPKITIDESRLGHIFREAVDHFHEDNAVNRQRLISAASRRENFVGTDRYGNAWFAEDLADGTQVWVRVRGDQIINGGLNHSPRDVSGVAR
jgi:hypothetical protein